MGTMARWEQWRALHGLAVAPGQPVVSYVGYSLKEPWGEPRVVIGIDAAEAEYLAEFLGRDECVQRGQVPLQAGPLQSGPLQQARDIAAELVGWNPGEVPGPLPEQFASWPPGGGATRNFARSAGSQLRPSIA